MRPLSSLRSRVFFVCAFVAALSIALGALFVTSRVSIEAESALRRDLSEAAALASEQYRARLDTLELVTSLVADLPKLKAAVSTDDPPTVAPLAADYRELVGSNFVAITNHEGRTLAALGSNAIRVPPDVLEKALDGFGSTFFHETDEGALEIVTHPILIDLDPPELLGTLSFGFAVDEKLAADLEALAQSEVVILAGRRVLATSLAVSPDESSRLQTLDGASEIAIGGTDYLGLPVALSDSADVVSAVVLRSRSERLGFLRTFRDGVLLASAIGVVLAILLSYAVARTVTHPLADITATMREISATGDLSRRLELQGIWHDEDTRLLTSTFNKLTESIARFQREAALEERLSALGRMSTVIAHEIRNPLMIIKASLRGLRRVPPSSSRVLEVADEIDHEVSRLNWMVGEVLDFARPLRVAHQPTDVNALCREKVDAVVAEDPGLRVDLSVEADLPVVETDAALLDRALVNVLANARDAVVERRNLGEDGAGKREDTDQPFDIVVETELLPGDDIAILIRDRGIGIAPEDLARIFEPYFTAKRTGTGLGLAITRNIVESLGGTISAVSEPLVGTEIRIVLPRRPDEAALDASGAGWKEHEREHPSRR